MEKLRQGVKKRISSIQPELSLLKNLFLTELKLRYKNSFLGFLWALIEPLAIALTLLIVFTRLFTNSLANFPAYILVGFTAWFFFSNGTRMVNVIVARSHIIKRVKFRRSLLVLTTCLVAGFNAIFEFGILMIVLSILGIKMSINVMMLPLILLLQFMFIFGMLLMLSSLFVKIRDLDKIWGILLQIGFFLTPICYPQSLLIKKFTLVLTLNPMMHFINTYRNILVYGKPVLMDGLLILIFISATSFLLGLLIFKRNEWRFSEEI